MENAQLVSLSRQIALQRQMDVVANNMANINTTGFKAEDMLFEQYRMPGAADNDFAGNQSVDYTQDWATIHDMTVGALDQTGNPLDVALSGPGFMTVQTPAGNRYTKAGSLAINAQGTLVDLSGNAVLSDAGTPLILDIEGEVPLNDVPGNTVNPRLSVGADWQANEWLSLRGGLSGGGVSGFGVGIGAGIRPADWLAIDIGTSEINGIFAGKRLDLAFRAAAGIR